MDAARQRCVVCGTVASAVCRGCKSVGYCGETCQRTHWKEMGHRIVDSDLGFDLLPSRSICDVCVGGGGLEEKRKENLLVPLHQVLLVHCCDCVPVLCLFCDCTVPVLCLFYGCAVPVL